MSIFLVLCQCCWFKSFPIPSKNQYRRRRPCQHASSDVTLIRVLGPPQITFTHFLLFMNTTNELGGSKKRGEREETKLHSLCKANEERKLISLLYILVPFIWRGALEVRRVSTENQPLGLIGYRYFYTSRLASRTYVSYTCLLINLMVWFLSALCWPHMPMLTKSLFS